MVIGIKKGEKGLFYFGSDVVPCLFGELSFMCKLYVGWKSIWHALLGQRKCVRDSC